MLSAYSGQKLDECNQKIEEINKFFHEETEDESKTECEGGTLSDVPELLGELGKKIKVEKLIKARPERSIVLLFCNNVYIQFYYSN